jgi:hypothetical protein
MNTEVLLSASGKISSLIWNVSKSTGPAKDACSEELGRLVMKTLKRTEHSVFVRANREIIVFTLSSPSHSSRASMMITIDVAWWMQPRGCRTSLSS